MIAISMDVDTISNHWTNICRFFDSNPSSASELQELDSYWPIRYASPTQKMRPLLTRGTPVGIERSREGFRNGPCPRAILHNLHTPFRRGNRCVSVRHSFLLERWSLHVPLPLFLRFTSCVGGFTSTKLENRSH